MLGTATSKPAGYLSVKRLGATLLLQIEEPILYGACQHEFLWLAIRDAIAAHADSTDVVISFASVKQLSSLTISVLVRVERYVLQCFKSLRLCEMSSGVRNAFSLLKLDGRRFVITDSVVANGAVSQPVKSPSVLDDEVQIRLGPDGRLLRFVAMPSIAPNREENLQVETNRTTRLPWTQFHDALLRTGWQLENLREIKKQFPAPVPSDESAAWEAELLGPSDAGSWQTQIRGEEDRSTHRST